MRPILFLRCKLAALLCLCLFLTTQLAAQAPANDNCSGAVTLTGNLTSCSPTRGTFLNAVKTAASTNWATIYTGSNPTVAFPAGTLVVECWGAGGAGGGATGSNSRGGGGGGGAYTYNNSVTVAAGNFAITGGTGGIPSTGNGPAGSNSSFGALVIANGGSGGFGASTSNSAGAGGSGGAAGSYAGGTGSAGIASTSSGAGGGGAGSGGVGGNASGTTGGAGGLIDGGAGAAGLSSNGNNFGNFGSGYGGGGGGAVKNNQDRVGGLGAAGAVRVSKGGDINSPDVWYKFVAASANPTIVLSNVGVDLQAKTPGMQLLSGACGSQTVLFYSATNSMATSGLTIGTTYYIRVSTFTNFASPTSGSYEFDICVQNPLAVPLNSIDYSKSYVNLTDGFTGGTINQNDILEIRATLVVKAGTITNVAYYDTLKRNAGFIFYDSIATRTNEGKNFATFSTNIVNDDPGWKAVIPVLLDTSIQINIGTGATATAGGTLVNTSKPSLFNSTCVIMATYRVKVDTGLVGYGRKINFGGGAFRYTSGGTNYVISFPRDSLIVYPTLTSCSDAVSPANLIGSANNGNFGTLTTGSSPMSTQNGGAASINTTYNYETFSTGPNDYYYGIANNTSLTNSTVQTAAKPGATRVFQLWDVTGDHTGATNTARGNLPCDPNQPVSATNPCGYMLTVNSSYRTDKVFQYTASGVCSDTYYEVSAWFKNLCSRCGCDVNGVSSGNTGYIPTAPGDSSGVRPNIAMQIDGIDYYTTGSLVYQGISGVPTATDTLNNWVRRSFVFKTSAAQSSFTVTFRNNAPGGGGNDWAVDDIGLRTCYPTMTYSPTNPIVYVGDTLVISDTVRSYFSNYTFYKWQKKPVSGSWADVVPPSTGQAIPVLVNGQYEYTKTYTVPATATQPANAGDEYRMVIASSAANLLALCNYTPSTTFTLVPADAPCAVTDTNYAVAPQTGHIDWNKLSWSLGHVPTCCESAHITYNSSKATGDSVIVDIYNDICIINLTLLNTSTTSSQLFKTILHPGYSMLMRGNVRMGATGSSSTSDSCVFIAKGGGTITVNGNTVIGYPTDNAYCVLGSSPDIASAHNYVLRGDSVTFNQKSFTYDKLITVTMSPFSDTAYFVNNANTSPYPNAVTFENLKIGNGTDTVTVIAGGTNGNSFLNNRKGVLEVTKNGTLVLPANYTINEISANYDTLLLRKNSTLRIGGYSGGTAGSNFPANFVRYTANAQSLVEYYGGNSNTQTVYGMTYGKLELRNGSNALGAGRAKKISTAPIVSATSINVNQQTDFTLGTAGSSAQTVSAAGTFDVAGGSGLYCNANVISGAGVFTAGNYSYLGIGHAQGISPRGSATGNIQMNGGRNYNSLGNYIYNGTVKQITGSGLPAAINQLTADNADTVVNSQNVSVNDTMLLKQGVFSIDSTRFKSNGANGILRSTGGKMKANRGIVMMAGTSGTAQTIDGTWFVNRNISTLIDSNTVGTTVAATVGDTVLISSALLYGSTITNSAIRTNDNLTLLSRDTATARFGEIITGSNNSIIGKVNVERYISKNRKWRHLAWNTASLQTANQSWMENNTPNGNASPGYGTIVTDEQATWMAKHFDSRSISGPSVKYYNPATNTYTGITDTQADTMNKHSAYYNFVRGDRSCLPSNSFISPTILRSTGTLKTGNQAFTIPATKFEAIGNPYASAIDLRGLDTSNLTSTFYVWDPQLTGIYGLGAYQTVYKSGPNYVVLPGGGSYGSLSSQVDTLESGQAMFVRARATAGTLTFKESAKTIGARTMARQGSIGENAFALLYYKDSNADSTLTLLDGCLTSFDPANDNAVDFEDALKLPNTGENAGFRREGQILSIERRRTVSSDDTLFLNLSALRIHRYQWNVILQNMDRPGLTGFFIDKYLNTSRPLDLNGATPIVFDIQSATGSWASDRFKIVFRQSSVLPVHFTSISAVRNGDKTVTVRWDAENEINMQDYKIEYSADGNHFTAIGTALPTANNGGSASYEYIDGHATASYNYYRIRGNSLNGHADYTAIAKVGPLSTEPVISINPNPVTGNTLNLRFENEPKGNYSVSISNKIGQVLHTETVSVQNGNFTKMITMGTKAAPGSYQAVIMDAAGKMTTIAFIVE